MGQCSLNFLDGIRFDKACDEGKHRYLNTKIYLFFKAVHCDILAKGKNTTVFTDGLTLRLPNCCWISCFQASSASQHGTTVCYVVLLFKNVFVEFLSGYIYTGFLSMYGIKQKYISIDNMCCIVSSSGLHQLATKTPSGAALGLRETQLLGRGNPQKRWSLNLINVHVICFVGWIWLNQLHHKLNHWNVTLWMSEVVLGRVVAPLKTSGGCGSRFWSSNSLKLTKIRWNLF